MGDYAAYPAYKDSEGEWIGFVPTGWPVKRLRFVLTTNPSKHEIDLPADAPVSFVPMEAVGGYGSLALDTEKPLDEIGSGYTFFAEGDIVVAKITPCFENGKGAIAQGLTNKVAFGTTELHVLRAGCELHSGFLFYLTISYAFRKIGEAYMYGAGGQKRIPDTFIKDFRLGIPSLSEQQAIARFLDHKTAQIDALIAKKEALLAKLAEKRTALISHAVTKGLDPTAPMQDSGIDWLGEIPAHWSVVPLMHLTQQNRPIMYGIVLPGPHVEEGVPIVKGGDVAPGRLQLDLLNRTSHEIESKYERSRLRGGDIVYAIRGSIGMVEIVPVEIEGANLTQDAARVAPNPDVEVRWLLYALRCREMFAQLDATATGATIRGINIKSLKRLQVPVPPKEEQSDLADFLDCETSRLNSFAEKVQTGIDRLKEYRTALITHAVTGKIDVRGVSLPAVDGAAYVARDDVRRQLVG